MYVDFIKAILFLSSVEATRASINRSIRDTVALTEKSSLQQLELTRSIKKLRKQLQIEKLRQKSVTSLLNTSLKELEDLRHKSVIILNISRNL